VSELGRRLVHAAGAGFPLAHVADRTLGLGVGWSGLQALVALGAAGALVLEALRLSGTVEWAVYDRLTREYEQEHLAGYALYMVGMAGAAFLFAPDVAVPAMLMLSLGDPISGLLGTDALAKQTWVLLVMFGVCVAIASFFLAPLPAVAGALAATLADGVKPVVGGYVIDDNLTIPLGGGAAMWAALAYLV
jgi:dolichol kinase